ncbi:MAG TPA: ABC transporter substrate-binding protein [Variovorax sp.]|nr:ABC transporter substrate-binding protein [Variovorax sp.]
MLHHPDLRRRLALLASAVSVLCAGVSAHAAGELAITVGVPGTLSGLPVHLANEKGYFREAGLDAKIISLTAGSAAVPQLLGGQLNFAAMDTVVTLTARSKNIPLVMTAPNTVGIANPERGFGNLVAGADSPVKSLKDLAGRTVAVNQINGTAWAIARGTLDNAGVDSSKVQFLEVPPPQLVAALQQGRADAAVLSEPGTSMATSQGMRQLSNVDATTVAGNHTFTFVSAEPWVKANPESVRRFNAVMIKANTELNGNRELAVALASRHTSVPPEILAKVFMPNFGTVPITPETLQKVVAVAIKYGVLPADKVPVLDSVIFK